MKSFLRSFAVFTLSLALCFLSGCIKEAGGTASALTSDTPAPEDSVLPSKTAVISKYYYSVENNGREGVVNERGQVVLPIEYSSVDILYYDNTPAAFFAFPDDVKTEREYSNYDVLLYNLNGAPIYKGKCNSILPGAFPISDSLIALLTERWGIISYEGEEVIPFRYNSIDRCGDYIVAVSGDFYDHPGKALDVDIYDKKGSLQNCGKIMFYDVRGSLIVVTDDIGRKFGLVDLNFKQVFPAVWDELRDEGNGLYLARYGKKWGVIDEQGKVIIPVKYNTLDCSSDSGDRAAMLFSAVDEDGVYILDSNGKQLFFSDKFTFAFIENGEIIAYDKDSSHYINTEGEDIIPPALHIDADAYGLIVWDNDGDSACYTKDGVKLPLPEAEYINAISPERFIFYTKDNRLKGLCGSDGSIIVPAEYNYLYPCDENNDLIIFKATDKSGKPRGGIFDMDGRIVLDGFDDLSEAGGGLFYARKGSVYGLIDINGAWIWQASDYETLMD